MGIGQEGESNQKLLDIVPEAHRPVDVWIVAVAFFQFFDPAINL